MIIEAYQISGSRQGDPRKVPLAILHSARGKEGIGDGRDREKAAGPGKRPCSRPASSTRGNRHGPAYRREERVAAAICIADAEKSIFGFGFPLLLAPLVGPRTRLRRRPQFREAPRVAGGAPFETGPWPSTSLDPGVAGRLGRWAPSGGVVPRSCVMVRTALGPVDSRSGCRHRSCWGCRVPASGQWKGDARAWVACFGGAGEGTPSEAVDEVRLDPDEWGARLRYKESAPMAHTCYSSSYCLAWLSAIWYLQHYHSLQRCSRIKVPPASPDVPKQAVDPCSDPPQMRLKCFRSILPAHRTTSRCADQQRQTAALARATPKRVAPLRWPSDDTASFGSHDTRAFVVRPLTPHVLDRSFFAAAHKARAKRAVSLGLPCLWANRSQATA